jgi:DNA repair photolyase
MIKISKVETKNILSKSGIPIGDYVINPYIGCPHKCIYCYAEFMKRFTNHYEDWGDFIDIKKCTNKINVNKLKNKTIIFSSVTDAYNPFEKKYNNTKGLLEQFINSNAKIEILTKSDLVIRDIEIFKKISNIRVGFSMNTLDDNVREKIEPYASSIEKRIQALRILHEEGINNYLFLSPMFPGITDYEEIINRCRGFVKIFSFENLNLRGVYRPRVLKYIHKYHPHLLSLYDDIYKLKIKDYWQQLEQRIINYCTKNKIEYRMFFYHEKIKKNSKKGSFTGNSCLPTVSLLTSC